MSLKEVAKETLAFLEAGEIVTAAGDIISFREELVAAVDGTKLYTPAQLNQLCATQSVNTGSPSIEVVNETTQIAAHRLVREHGIKDLVLLNFASARNPGGGFVSGAKAQEEDLTRCSGLYPCLLAQPQYYKVNRNFNSLLYTDHMIYSPQVPWFRTRSRNLLDHVFLASVITAPAPNAGEVLKRDPDAWPAIETCLRSRCEMVLGLARHQGHRHLLLGAWGCGVFRNDPRIVADAFGTPLESGEFSGAFDHVVFAVLDRSRSGATCVYRTIFLGHACVFANKMPE